MSKQDEDFYTDDHSDQNYIDEMVAFQNNQFNPEYYLGARRTHPAFKASGNALPLAIWLFIQAAGLILFYCFLFIHSDTVTITFVDGSPLLNFIVITLFFLAATFACIWFGVFYLKKAKLYRLKKRQLEESGASDSINEEPQIAQKTCPACGKEHDMDYPKCPYCQHPYATLFTSSHSTHTQD